MLVFIWENVFGLPQKPWLCTENTECTSSAIFGVGTVAKGCELKRCADRVRSRTDNKDEVFEGKFRNLNFSPSTKKTTDCSFEHFLSIYRYFIFFSSVKLQHCRNNRFSALVAQKHRAISRQEKMTFSFQSRVALGLPSPSPRVSTDEPTYVRAYADIRTKFSRIDRLPNLLSNNAPLLRLASHVQGVH